MSKGTVKWFSNERSFGFIAGEDGRAVFVHSSAILGSEYKFLVPGEQVGFETLETQKGLQALNVTKLPDDGQTETPKMVLA